jgi:hypothetical protein
MNLALLLLQAADSSQMSKSPDTVAAIIAAITGLIVVVIQGIMGALRHAQSDKTQREAREASERRLTDLQSAMEIRLRGAIDALSESVRRESSSTIAAMAEALRDHEERDNRDFLRKDVYEADQEHSAALRMLLAKAEDQRHERR